MGGASPARGTSRRLFSVLATIVFVGGLLAQMAGGGQAAERTSCRAKNVTQGTPSRRNLQEVIDASSRGDLISVRNVCVGNFTIEKKLTLAGKSTADVRRPVLDANGTGRVLEISARVGLTDLKITGGAVSESLPDGSGDDGAGIRNSGRLVLKGTLVTGNAALDQGGGIINGGTLVMDRSSSVKGNTGGAGGGITNAGTLVMNDSSSVRGNGAGVGGGITNYGTLVMNDSSSVRGNGSDGDAGGIFNNGLGVTMNDSSSITGNTAGDHGGGIDNRGPLTMNDSSSITGNTADADDADGGTGGGIFVCGGSLVGAVDGDNVDENHTGTATPTEDNIHVEIGC